MSWENRARLIALVIALIIAVIIYWPSWFGDEPEIAPAPDAPAVFTAKAAEAPEIPENPNEEMLIEQALLAKATKIENCKITYYCAEPYEHICGYGQGITASGRELVPYRSCAVDPSVIPLGATVMVDYGDGRIQYYSADDTGGAVDGEHIDLCVQAHEEALDLGVKYATVFWLEEG